MYANVCISVLLTKIDPLIKRDPFCTSNEAPFIINILITNILKMIIFFMIKSILINAGLVSKKLSEKLIYVTRLFNINIFYIFHKYF